MARILKGILGGFSGTVGTVVGANWRGVDIIRSRPKASGKEPTLLQINQRLKFALVTKFLQPISDILSSYFGSPTGEKSRMNNAVSYHVKEACTVTDGVASIEYNKVMISKGDLNGLMNLQTTAAPSQGINLTWTDNSDQGNALGTDQLIVVLYNETQAEMLSFLAVATRNEGTANIVCPASYAGQSVYLWASFVRAAGTMAASSTYGGTIAINA